MSVLIKGMEMPESCNACRLLEGDRDDGLCHAANRWLDDDEYWLWHQYPEGDVDTSKPSNCPLIDVPDRKVGEWIEKGGVLMCSECGDAWGTEQFDEVKSFNYCPNCGAEMEGE